MIKSHIDFIQQRVSKELSEGSTLSVYRLASVLHLNCQGVSLQEAADAVTEAVVAARVSSYWIRSKPVKTGAA